MAKKTLTSCPRCQGKLVPISERTGGFSGKKAVAGFVLAGPVGAAAGALGKKLVTMQCEDCGYIIEVDANTSERVEHYELERQIAREWAKQNDTTKILIKQAENRLNPRWDTHSDPILTATQRNAQYQQNSVIACGLGIAAVREDGTVMLTSDFPYEVKSAVKKWNDIISVAVCGYAVVGLRSDGKVEYAATCDFCGELEWENITAIAVGSYHILGLRSDGTVAAAGTNKRGQCNTENWENIISIAAGSAQSLGIDANGTVVTAGAFENGSNNIDRDFLNDWHDLMDIRTNIIGISSSESPYVIYGIRKDGAVYGVAGGNKFQTALHHPESNGDRTSMALGEVSPYRSFLSAKEDLMQETGIVAVSVPSYSNTVSFLRIDGTVLTSAKKVTTDENGRILPCPYRKSTENWEEIVAVVDEGDIRVGVRADGTLIASTACFSGKSPSDEYRLKLEKKVAEVMTWNNIRVIPEVKERVLRLAQERRLRVAKEAQKNKEETPEIEQATQKTSQTQRMGWQALGKCQHCGGDFSFFTKKCKTCNTKKDY